MKTARKWWTFAVRTALANPLFINGGKYSGMEVNDLNKMKDVEAELAQFKRIIADLTLQ